MEISFLGVHNLESADTRLVSLLIDGVLALDAGAVTSTLSFEQQQRIEAFLISHHHFDHIRDLATFGLANIEWGTKKVYSIKPVLDVIRRDMLNGNLYPDMTRIPSPDTPSLKMQAVEEYKPVYVNGYRVLAVPVEHGVPTVGYEVTDGDGKSVFYSADTTGGIEECWQYISPDLMIVETTLPDRMRDFAIEVKHLCPSLLAESLAEFKKIKGYVPTTVVVHINPVYESEIGEQLNHVSEELKADILIGYEGMQIVI